MIPTLKFEGGVELQKALESLPSRVSKRIQYEALFHAAEPMRRTMELRAPVEPGKPDAKDTMMIRRTKSQDAHESTISIGPSKAGWYLSWQELGTAHHAPQPFARPAFDENVGRALQRLGEDIWVSLAGRGISRSQTVSGAVMGEEV
jgi:HK97 gp10 family phage protein